ncbi:MAG: 4Fe-4S dicluster domain-containing protein, partial [Desulfohalobiaceae bacterium]|nr:4Fe-4S dicluster domain-containing protein [Desulfohalobiaceae bacterium]
MHLSQAQINYCMECGVCTGSCPVSSELESFSPRQIIKRTLVEGDENFLHGHDLWACLSCGRCSDRCPVGISFHEYLRNYREEARKINNLPKLSHHGSLQTLNAIQTRDIQQNRTAWAETAGRFQETGD